MDFDQWSSSVNDTEAVRKSKKFIYAYMFAHDWSLDIIDLRH